MYKYNKKRSDYNFKNQEHRRYITIQAHNFTIKSKEYKDILDLKKEGYAVDDIAMSLLGMLTVKYIKDGLGQNLD